MCFICPLLTHPRHPGSEPVIMELSNFTPMNFGLVRLFKIGLLEILRKEFGSHFNPVSFLLEVLYIFSQQKAPNANLTSVTSHLLKMVAHYRR